MHFGQMFFEIPHVFRMKPHNVDRYVIFDGEVNLINALGKKKGVFVLTAHFGNWELMCAAASLRFGNVAVIARPADFVPFDRMINELRSRFGTEVIPKQRAMRRLLSAVKDNKIVAGGGATEAEIAKVLRGFATKVGGREQLAIEAFADSLEIVPKTLAENAGLESIDILVGLRAAHEKKNGHLMGVDVFKGKIVNSYENGVVEPLKVKEQAMKSAGEVASMILRIDDVIASTKPKEGAPPGGMPPDY